MYNFFNWLAITLGFKRPVLKQKAVVKRKKLKHRHLTDFTKRRVNSKGNWEFYNYRLHAWYTWDDLEGSIDTDNVMVLVHNTISIRSPYELGSSANQDLEPSNSEINRSEGIAGLSEAQYDNYRECVNRSTSDTEPSSGSCGRSDSESTNYSNSNDSTNNSSDSSSLSTGSD